MRIDKRIRQKIMQLMLGKSVYHDITNLRGGGGVNPLTKITPKATLDYVVISLVEHCNLNCWGCDHFSPLAEESFLDLAIFERDISRLAELSQATVGHIGLMGGEPLLHPQKEAFFSLARRYFPHSRISLTTNGILLAEQPDKFWSACRENRILIRPTKYPLKIDWEVIIQKCHNEKIDFTFYSGDVLKTSWHIPLDVTGTQNTVSSFVNCSHANECCELLNGRIYTCTVRPHATHFNRVFAANLRLLDEDAIDIHHAKNMREILEFLAKPIPFCRYCEVGARSDGHHWQISRKDLAEWIVK